MYNYFTYCKIVSFLLFTGLTRFTHRFMYCVQCHIGCENKLTVYIRLVSLFIFGPLVETVPLVILIARGIIVNQRQLVAESYNTRQYTTPPLRPVFTANSTVLQR